MPGAAGLSCRAKWLMFPPIRTTGSGGTMRKIILAAVMLSAAATIALAQQGGRGPVTPNPDIRLPPFAPSAAATTFNLSCLRRHSNNLDGTPRARSLFNAEFLANRSDNEIVRSIMTGFPAGKMPAFKDRISEALAHQLVYYMRITGGRLNRQVVPAP